MIITIDGPVASGKSTVATILANRLGFYHVNTGLFYRAVAYVVKTEQRHDFDFIKNIAYTFEGGQPVVRYNGNDITPYLKEKSFDQLASQVSANPLVREHLLGPQRVMGECYNVIADGRDCGSVVYPNAAYKFYLTASLDERTNRLALYLQQKEGQTQDFNTLRLHIAERDKRDAERPVAPLRIPSGAIVIDNSAMTIEQTVDELMRVIKFQQQV